MALPIGAERDQLQRGQIACETGHSVKQALGLLQVMRRSPLVLYAVSYSAAMSTYENGPLVEAGIGLDAGYVALPTGACRDQPQTRHRRMRGSYGSTP